MLLVFIFFSFLSPKGLDRSQFIKWVDGIIGWTRTLSLKTLLSSFLPIYIYISFSWFMLLFPDQLDYFNVLVFSRNSVNLGKKTRKLTCRNSWVFFLPFPLPFLRLFHYVPNSVNLVSLSPQN